ncbi:MAG: PaaX family transcriptional regulator C-terminal domain-containing protein [Acidimicrobiales bacterium]
MQGSNVPGSSSWPSDSPALTARSVLASALLGEDPPELPVSHLVQLARLFGITDNRARVALSRMVVAGEVVTDGSGRYRLAGHLVDRMERQAVSRRGDTVDWDGRWIIVVITASGRPAEVRQARRRRLVVARLAERREGLWLRPANIELRPDPAEDPDLDLFVGTPDRSSRALAAELWDLDGWARTAAALLKSLADLPPAGPEQLVPGFVLSAAVIRHLQIDPLLPHGLLPGEWPGSELRSAYDRWDRRYREVLRQWGRRTREGTTQSSGGSGVDLPEDGRAPGDG